MMMLMTKAAGGRGAYSLFIYLFIRPTLSLMPSDMDLGICYSEKPRGFISGTMWYPIGFCPRNFLLL